jgi:hypothetical protein
VEGVWVFVALKLQHAIRYHLVAATVHVQSVTALPREALGSDPRLSNFPVGSYIIWSTHLARHTTFARDIRRWLIGSSNCDKSELQSQAAAEAAAAAAAAATQHKAHSLTRTHSSSAVDVSGLCLEPEKKKSSCSVVVIFSADP